MRGITNARLDGGGTGGIEKLVGTSASPLNFFTTMEAGKLYYFSGYFYGLQDAVKNATDTFLAYRTTTIDNEPCVIVYGSYMSSPNLLSEPWCDSVFIFDTTINKISGYVQQNKMNVINGSSARAISIYAPTVSGSSGQFLVSHGAGNAPQWETITYIKSASASGDTLTLTLQNNTTVTFTPSGPADYIKSASVNNNTLTLTDKNNNTITFTPSGPDTYIKSASYVGNTLVLTKQDNTTFTFTPANDHEPAAFLKSASVNGNTLTLVNQNNVGTTFTAAAPPNIVKNTTATSVSQQLANNSSYRYTQNLSSLTLSFPTMTDDYESEVVFKSGSTATTFSQGSTTIKWSGDDVSNNAFSPLANKTYNILFWYDSVNLNAIVRGV